MEVDTEEMKDISLIGNRVCGWYIGIRTYPDEEIAIGSAVAHLGKLASLF